ncbi:hypothetical protein BJX99DRAFT_226000 [Aspergillus californicus]
MYLPPTTNYAQPGVRMTTPQGKLRTSCDACAASKVRCSKEQPRCARCTQHDHKCVYGRSRRKGKPPGGANRAPLQHPERNLNISGSVPPTGSMGNNRWHLAEIFTETNYAVPATNHLMQGGWKDIASAGAAPYERIVFSSSVPEYAMDTQWNKELAPDVPSFRLSPDYTELRMPLTDELTDLMGATVASSPINHLDAARGGPDSSDGGEENTIQNDEEMEPNSYDRAHESCIFTACQALSSLYQLVRCDNKDQHSPQLQQKTPTSKQVPRSDSVFRTARAATEIVSQLLNCPCSSAHDPSLLSLLATIVSRILAWYQVLYDHDIASSGPEQITVTPSPAMSSSRQDNSIYTVPLTIGTLHLPAEIETKMKAQLLLCELKPVLDASQLLFMQIRASEDTWGEKVICEEFNIHIQQKLGGLRQLLTLVCS